MFNTGGTSRLNNRAITAVPPRLAVPTGSSRNIKPLDRMSAIAVRAGDGVAAVK